MNIFQGCKEIIKDFMFLREYIYIYMHTYTLKESNYIVNILHFNYFSLGLSLKTLTNLKIKDIRAC